MEGAAIDLGHALHLLGCALVAAIALRGARASLPPALVALSVGRLLLELLAVASIAAQGDGGTLAEALGSLGAAPGLAVLLLLLAAQVLLVANGGERAAEVAARFALDAMPGRQMAVDADLRAGALTPEGATRRRKALLAEAAATGALDGAFRFVKGDAIAGALAVCVNVVAGGLAAVWGRGESFREALPRVVALAVGQGLAIRLPAVLVAGVAASVTGTSPSPSPRATTWYTGLVAGSAINTMLLFAPGVRAWPFALVALASGLTALGLRRHRAPTTPTLVLQGTVEALVKEEVETAMDEALSALGLPLAARVLHTAGEATLRVHGVPVASGATVDALWARTMVRRHAWRALGLDDVQTMLDRLAIEAPALVRTVLAAHGLASLAEVLRALVREEVSIAPLRAVLEAIERAGAERDPKVLVERVRVALGPVSLPEGAWMVDPVITAVLRDLGRPGVSPKAALTDDLVRAVRAAVGDDPAPVLVVEQALRQRLRAAIERDLPTVRVVGFDELAEIPTRRGWVRAS